jgi:hypothetical protein
MSFKQVAAHTHLIVKKSYEEIKDSHIP